MEPVALIREWLGCSDEAGGLVWFQPTIFPSAALFDIYKAQAVRKGWEWVRRGLRIDRCELEGFASDAVLKVHDRLKRRGGTEEEHEEIETPPREDMTAGGTCSAESSLEPAVEAPAIKGTRPGQHYEFSSVGEFLTFLNVSVPGAMHDILNRHVKGLRGDPPPNPPPPPGETPYDPIRPRGRAEGEHVSLRPKPLEEVQQRMRRERATRLVPAFRARLDRHRVLQVHLDGVVTAQKEGRAVPDEIVAEDVIDFLETTWKHRCHVRRWFLEQGTSEDNYYMRNRRLRTEWRIFRDGPGKPDYVAYRELLK